MTRELRMITVNCEKSPHVVELEATVIGNWAVHPTLVTEPARTSLWSVTYVPMGLAAKIDFDREGALRAAEDLAREVPTYVPECLGKVREVLSRSAEGRRVR